MVQPRLGILSTIDSELTRVSDLVNGQDFSGELVSVDTASGLATVRVRSKRVVGETVLISNAGVLFPDPQDFVGFDVILRAPNGLNGEVYAVGPVLRGSVVFNTAALAVSEDAFASDPIGPAFSTAAFGFDLSGTGTVLVQSVVVALDSVDGARPFVRLNAGSAEEDWFAAGILPDAADETGMAVFVTFTKDAPLRVPAGTTLTVTGLAAATSTFKPGSWRAYLTADSPPSGQVLTTTDSPLPLLRIHGTVE